MARKQCPECKNLVKRWTDHDWDCPMVLVDYAEEAP